MSDQLVTTSRDGEFFLLDGNDNELSVPLDAGEASITGLTQTGAEMVRVYARGVCISERKGKDVEVQIKITAYVSDLSSLTEDILLDFLHFSGKYAGNITDDYVPNDVKLLKWRYDMNTEDGTAQWSGRATSWSYDWAESLEGTKLTLTGTCAHPETIERVGSDS